jgi:hypothetical protein
MSADEGAAIRVASAVAAQDPLLGRDLVALVRDYFEASGESLTGQLDPMYADAGTPDLPRARRLHAFGAALLKEVGDEKAEQAELENCFIVQSPKTEYRCGDEASARESVRKCVRELGRDTALRDVKVFLQIQATGTRHSLGVERFLD